MDMSKAGIILGGVVIVFVLALSWRKKNFSPSLLVALIFGSVLVAIPQWKSIDFEGFDVKLNILAQQVETTAAAAEQIAGQAEHTAAAVDATRGQLVTLSRSLRGRGVIAGPAFTEMDRELAAAPRPDLTVLKTARERLAGIARTTRPPP